MLGFGEPLFVREGQRVLLHILNASATLMHDLALPGHQFLVTALDGNPVARPARVQTLRPGPAERVDAVVEMQQPGVWVLGETNPVYRRRGMGIVVEYANHSGAPQWSDPEKFDFQYENFGGAVDASPAEGDEVAIPDVALQLTPGFRAGRPLYCA